MNCKMCIEPTIAVEDGLCQQCIDDLKQEQAEWLADMMAEYKAERLLSASNAQVRFNRESRFGIE